MVRLVNSIMEKTSLIVCLILAAAVAQDLTTSEVCRNLANGIQGEYPLEDVNECYECTWTKLDETERIWGAPSFDIDTGAESSRMESDSAWCATGSDDYLEIDVGKLTKLGGVSVKGYEALDSWITSYQVSYKDEAGVFHLLNDVEGNVEEFDGSTDATTLEERKFSVPVQTSAIRIIPKSSHRYPCMKVDVYHCGDDETADKVPSMYRHGTSGFDVGYWGDICTINVVTDCEGNEDTCIFYKKDIFGCDTCECDEVPDNAKFESDITLTPLTKAAVEASYGKANYGVMRAASRNQPKWTDYKSGNNYNVPYVLSSSLSSRAPGAITSAIQELSRHTCIRLVRRSNERNYINFYRGGGCSSPVGKNGRNDISIGSGCEHSGTVVHEILHSLGFWHEQSRPDRDQYIRIRTSNIVRGLAYNFQKRHASEINSYQSPYDMSSVMHYGSHAFSANGQATIVDLSGNPVRTQRRGLSEEDIKQINQMYPCSGTGTGTTTTASTKPTVVPTTTTTGNCADQHRYCSYWSRIGECTKNPGYMLLRCKKSCGKCGGGGNGKCQDKNRRCSRWTSYCSSISYFNFMTKNCARTCNKC